jgi:hypothetical protein
LADATLYWGGDLTCSPTGDLAISEGDSLGQQRVLRRLLTNANDYTWHPDYGGGLGRFVGGVVNARTIEGTIRAQLYTEAAVAHRPEPNVAANALPDGSVYANITYSDAQSLATQTLTFSLDY